MQHADMLSKEEYYWLIPTITVSIGVDLIEGLELLVVGLTVSFQPGTLKLQ